MLRSFVLGAAAGGAAYISVSNKLWDSRQQHARDITAVHAYIYSATRYSEVRAASAATPARVPHEFAPAATTRLPQRPLTRGTDVVENARQRLWSLWNFLILEAHDAVVRNAFVGQSRK